MSARAASATRAHATHEPRVALGPSRPAVVAPGIDVRAPLARLDPQVRDEHHAQPAGVGHLDGARDVAPVALERRLEREVDPRPGEVRDAPERRERDPGRAHRARLGERAIVRGRAVADARVVAVLDRADGDAADAADLGHRPRVRPGRRDCELGGERERDRRRVRQGTSSSTASVSAARLATTASAPATQELVARVRMAHRDAAEPRALGRGDAADRVLDGDRAPSCPIRRSSLTPEEERRGVRLGGRASSRRSR